jgi:glycosyltransferase involved in cell wall biosynthesis
MLATEFANRASGGRGEHTWSLTVHGPYEFYEVENEALPEKVRSSDFAVSVSDFGRSQLMAFVEEEHWSKLHVVHCGVQANAYPAGDAGGKPDELRLLAVGRLNPVKGHAILLQALAELRTRGTSATLAIVGDGPKRQDLEELAGRLGLGDAVTFTGAVGQDGIAAHYEAADVLVHASFAEGIPVVLMEAMAHRLPVVAAGVMGVAELVRDGENGVLVRPGRPDELADAVERLAEDPDLRRRMGEEGRRTVESEFDVSSNAARLRELFRQYAGY